MTDPGTDVAEPGTEVVPADESGGALVAHGDHAPVVADGSNHPTPRQYVLVGIVLVIITGVEVATSYIDTAHTNLIIAALAVGASIKFFLVCSWYMHMKTDMPFFRRVFITGMILACFVYGILLLMFSSTVLKS